MPTKSRLMLASRPAVLIPGCVGFQAKAFVPQASTPKFQLDWHRLACTLSAPESCPRTVSEPPICRCSLGGAGGCGPRRAGGRPRTRGRRSPVVVAAQSPGGAQQAAARCRIAGGRHHLRRWELERHQHRRGLNFGALKAASGLTLHATKAWSFGTTASYAVYGTSVEAQATTGAIQLTRLTAKALSRVSTGSGNLRISTVGSLKSAQLVAITSPGVRSLPTGF